MKHAFKPHDLSLSKPLLCQIKVKTHHFLCLISPLFIGVRDLELRRKQMTLDRNKLEEEACVLRFYKIVLSWDYIRILKESQVVSYFLSFFISFFLPPYFHVFWHWWVNYSFFFFKKKIILEQKDKNNRGDGSSQGLQKVKDTYKDVEEYLATFEPLLFEEVKAQIVQGKDDEEGIWLFWIAVKCLGSLTFYFCLFTLP